MIYSTPDDASQYKLKKDNRWMYFPGLFLKRAGLLLCMIITASSSKKT